MTPRVAAMTPFRCWWMTIVGLAALTGTHIHASDTRIDAAPVLELSAEERTWLAEHPVLRVGFDPSWPPFSAWDQEAGLHGIDADLLRELSRRLGVTFEPVTRGSWPEVYEAAKRGEIDFLAGTARTGERERVFRFTQPYLSFPVVIIMRNDEPILWSVLDLVGRRVVGVRGYVATEEMARQYPMLTLVGADTVHEAMRMVAENRADAFVTNLPNASFEAKIHGLTNLKIAGVMPDRFDLRYAVRADMPELAALLDRAIASLSEMDRQALVHPWIRVDYAKVIRWDLVWKTAAIVLSVFGLALAAVVYHNRRLARELAERIRLQREIKEAHDELLRLNEDKTELLQMAAHDLRGPLTGIQLAIDACLRLRALGADDALRVTEKQVRQMTQLLGDLLDVEALEHGQREFKIERHDAAAKLQEAVAAAGAAAAQKNIRIETNIAPGLPAVDVDATALRQIFDNLLSNALKFSPRGGVVSVTLARREGYLRVEIRDEGAGVAPDETEKIFGKYARGSTRPTEGEKSTGLGLSIVRQLAASMNARVWCEPRTAAGGGLFIVVLPVPVAA